METTAETTTLSLGQYVGSLKATRDQLRDKKAFLERCHRKYTTPDLGGLPMVGLGGSCGKPAFLLPFVVRFDLAKLERLEFSLLAPSNNPIRLRAAELVAQDLNRGGVKVSVRTMENEALVQQVWPDFDVSKERSYELSIFGWSAPVASQARLGSLLHSDPAVGNLNLSGYSNLEADALIDEAAVTTDDAARTTLLQNMQEVMARDLPLITLFYQDGVFAYRPAVFDSWVFMAGQGIINKNSFVGR